MHNTFQEVIRAFRKPPHPQNQVSRDKRKEESNPGIDSLFLGSLLSSLGNLTSLVGLDDGLDDTDGNGLTHVTDGETTKWWVVSERPQHTWAWREPS